MCFCRLALCIYSDFIVICDVAVTTRKGLSSTRKSFVDTMGEKDCSVTYFLRSAGRWLSGSKEQEDDQSGYS